MEVVRRVYFTQFLCGGGGIAKSGKYQTMIWPASERSQHSSHSITHWFIQCIVSVYVVGGIVSSPEDTVRIWLLP